MSSLQAPLPVIVVAGGIAWHAADEGAARQLQEQHEKGSPLLKLLLRQKFGARPLVPERLREAITLLNRTAVNIGQCGENAEHCSVVGDTNLCRDCCAEILGRAQ
jgi:hypothetical protein